MHLYNILLFSILLLIPSISFCIDGDCIPVLNKDISKNTVINISTDITCTTKIIQDNRQIFIHDPSEIDGMVATTNIEKMKLIRKNAIRKPFLIIKNSPITIEYKSTNGIVKIKKRGISLENGSLNDTVRIKTNNSQTERQGIVKGKNIVVITQ